MLVARKLFRVQGFPDSYVIDPVYNGKPLSKTRQIQMCGNSVCPQIVEALVGANLAVESGAVREVPGAFLQDGQKCKVRARKPGKFRS